MKVSKRVLAMLLAVLMVASVAPMSVLQAAAENVTEAVSGLGGALAVNSEEASAAEPAADESALPPENNETKASTAETASAGFYAGVVSIGTGETVWARGYLIYRDAAGEIHTVYSPISSYTR